MEVSSFHLPTSFEILKQNLADLEEANKWLIHSYQICERWLDRSDLEVPEYDAIKSFFSLYTYLWSATMKDISLCWRFWVGTIRDHAGCAKSCWKERTDRLIRASKRVDGTAKSNFPWLRSPRLPLYLSWCARFYYTNFDCSRKDPTILWENLGLKLGMPVYVRLPCVRYKTNGSHS